MQDTDKQERIRHPREERLRRLQNGWGAFFETALDEELLKRGDTDQIISVLSAQG